MLITFYASREHVKKSSLKGIVSIDWAGVHMQGRCAWSLHHCKHIAAMVGYEYLERPTCMSLPYARTKLRATDPDTSRAVANIPHGSGIVDIDAREGQPQALRLASVASPNRYTRVAIDATNSTEIETYDDGSLENKFLHLFESRLMASRALRIVFGRFTQNTTTHKSFVLDHMNDSRLR